MSDAAELLKEIRGRSGLSQRELARRCGISHVNISNIEHDKNQPTLPTLQRLAAKAGFNVRLILVPEVDALVEYLRSQVMRWELQPIHMSLFGSAARDEMGPESDIDLFIVLPDEVVGNHYHSVWKHQMSKLSISMVETYRHVLDIQAFSLQETVAFPETEPIFYKALSVDGILIAGTPFDELVPS